MSDNENNYPFPNSGPGALVDTGSISMTGAEREPSLGDLLLLLARHWRVIVLSTLGALIAGCLFCLVATRRFTATATLEYRSVPTVTPREREDRDSWNAAREEKYLQTQVAKLKRLNVADFVLNSSGLGERLKQKNLEERWYTDWLQSLKHLFSRTPANVDGRYHYSESFLRSYLKLIRAQPVFATSLVNVSVTTDDPVLSRDTVNAHVNGFLEFDRQERQGQIVETLSFLQGQADALREKVAGLERELAQYAEEKQLLTLSNEESVVVREISDLTQLLSQAIARRIRSESLLQGQQENSIEQTPLLDDEAIRAQRVQLKQAEAEYAALARQATSAYPPMQQLLAKIRGLQTNIREQRQQALLALRSRFEGDLASEQQLRSQLDGRKQAAFRNSRDLVRYNIMRREYDSLKDLYQSILRQVKEEQVSSTSKGSNIGVADYAITPERPSSPRIPLVLTVSAALGLVFGCVLVGFRRVFDHSVDSTGDISAQLRLPTLGVVPLFPIEERAKALPRRDTLRRLLPLSGAADTKSAGTPLAVPPRMSAAAEAFRAVRTALLLSCPDYQPRVILIASAQPGEGKTTIAANLATTLAQAQHRTLLIEADLRRGDLRRRFGLPKSRAGLADVLNEKIGLLDAIQPVGIRKLDVLIAGTRTAKPAELLSAPKMKELIPHLRKIYDYIVLDSAPIDIVADALMLSSMVDGVIVVMRSAVTDKRVAHRTLERLRQVKAHLLGVIVNGVKHTQNGIYDEYRQEFEDQPIAEEPDPNSRGSTAA